MAQALLVILIGIYAIRASWFIFGVFSPLTPVAGIVLILCIFAFHKSPVAGTIWFWVLISMCVLGAIANASLLFSSSPTYNNPTNMAFSAVSLTCFILLGGYWAYTATQKLIP